MWERLRPLICEDHLYRLGPMGRGIPHHVPQQKKVTPKNGTFMLLPIGLVMTDLAIHPLSCCFRRSCLLIVRMLADVFH